MYIYTCQGISFLDFLIMLIEQTGPPAKLIDYFLWSNKSNINQPVHSQGDEN